MFDFLRRVATAALTFAALLGVGVAGLSPNLNAFWIGLTSSVVCILILCGLYELD